MPNPLDRPRSVFMLQIKGEYGLCSFFENEIENFILYAWFLKTLTLFNSDTCRP